jgi:hypothetical protein
MKVKDMARAGWEYLLRPPAFIARPDESAEETAQRRAASAEESAQRRASWVSRTWFRYGVAALLVPAFGATSLKALPHTARLLVQLVIAVMVTAAAIKAVRLIGRSHRAQHPSATSGAWGSAVVCSWTLPAWHVTSNPLARLLLVATAAAVWTAVRVAFDRPLDPAAEAGDKTVAGRTDRDAGR